MTTHLTAAQQKRVAALARKKDRLTRGLFLVEGPQAVRELLIHAPELVSAVYLTADDALWRSELESLASAHDVAITPVTDTALAAMADTVQPQGVLAVARIVEHRIAPILTTAQLVVVLHRVRDPGNAGTVLRAADAAGADAVIFSGESVDPWHPKLVRATTGSLFHLPVMVAADLGELAHAATTAGLHLLAADVRGESLQPDHPALADRIAWVFGNESNGLSATERALAERSIRVPMYGKAESLNLATAASICLYLTAFAQRAHRPDE